MDDADSILIGRDAVAEDFVVAQRIASFSAGITRGAFDGVDSTVFDLFHNAYMVGKTILGTG